MKTILIPVDFSEGSLNSCKYAFDFLGREEATVHLFHIYNDQVLIPDSGFTGGGMDTETFFNSDILVALKEQAENQLEGLEQELNGIIQKNNQRIQLKHTLMGGDPQWEITETIAELHPDMVIMGTQGNGKKGFLEGRMAARIMNKSSVPVLAVPNDFNQFRITSVLYTTSFKPLDVDSLKLLFRILGDGPAKIHVVHFMKEKEIQTATAMMEMLEQAFKKEIQKQRMDFYSIQTENEKESLMDFTEQNEVDLVAFLPGKKHLIKDFFSSHKLHKKDLFNLELPLLAIHL